MILSVFLEENHFEMITKPATYPSWYGCKDEAHNFRDSGKSQDSDIVKMVWVQLSTVPHGSSSIFVYLQGNKEYNVEQ